jgi:hypothetical protein
VLGMLTVHEVERLEFVFHVCLGYIAFAAGSELFYPDIKDRIASIIKARLGL